MPTIVIGAVLGLVIGAALGFWLRGRELGAARAEIERLRQESAARAGFEALATERAATIAQMSVDRESLRAEIQGRIEAERLASARISGLEAELRKERESMAEKIALLDTAEKTLSNKFETLANDILDKKKKSFSDDSQRELKGLIDPLQKDIKEFREKVEAAQTSSTLGVGEIKTLIGALGDLNRELSQEAHNLSTALRRDTKAQGNWGETILRNILDKSGLQEGINYTFQQRFIQTDADGEPMQDRYTDVVVKLPGGRHLIVDSKVSLNDYQDFVNADSEKDRAEALKRHLGSVRKHFIDLASRNYQKLPGMQSPDFVVMFVPIEPAFLLALQNSESLWHEAYQKGVLLSGPTTVLFVIGIVKDLWRQQEQAANVEKVMKQCESLYDKFVGFANNLSGVGDALDGARRVYDDAAKQLSSGPGNLVGQVEKLRTMAHVTPKGKKRIPQKFLEAAEIESPLLALAAEAETESEAEVEESETR